MVKCLVKNKPLSSYDYNKSVWSLEVSPCCFSA